MKNVLLLSTVFASLLVSLPSRAFDEDSLGEINEAEYKFCSQNGDCTMQDCPVVANTESKIYHTHKSAHYKKMLVKNKGKDNRVCFDTEAEAALRYRKSKN